MMKKQILLGAILVLAGGGLLFKINKPFIGIHDWNGVTFGYEMSHWSFNFGATAHYFPLLSTYFFLVTRIFGVSEITLRMSVAVISLIFLVYMFRINLMFVRVRAALASVLLISLTPLFLYYGKLPDHDPVEMCLSALAIFYFFQFVKDRKNNHFVKFLIFYVLALLESWPSFFLWPFFLLILRKAKNINKKAVVSLVAGMPVAIFAIFIFMHLLDRENFNNLMATILFRANLKTSSYYEFNLVQYFVRLTRYHVVLYTATLLALAAAGVFQVAMSRRNTLFKLKLATLFGYGIIFPAIFQNLYWIHEYKTIHLLPFIGVSAALGITLIFQALKSHAMIAKMLMLALGLAVFFERRPYLLALLQSSHTKEAYEIGRYVKKNIKKDALVTIVPASFNYINGPFISFYAGRSVQYADISVRTEYLILASGANTLTNQKWLQKERTLLHAGDFAVFR